MADSGITADPNQSNPSLHSFEIDFSALRRATKGALRRMVSGPEQDHVDPFIVAEAICRIMSESQHKDVDGQTLVWNHFTVFLSRRDYEGFRPLKAVFDHDLGKVLERHLSELNARLVGDPVVRLTSDDQRDLARGRGHVDAEFVSNEAIRPEGDDEITVRVSNPYDGAAGPSADQLSIEWPGGKHVLSPGNKVVLGREHHPVPNGFVALGGASRKISSRHVAIENSGGNITITRPDRANPVHVGDRLVEPGRKTIITFESLPTEVRLSHSEMSLRLRPFR